MAPPYSSPKTPHQYQRMILLLRNLPRKPWSLCITYGHGGQEKPFYPDLIVFRREKAGLRIDLLDPHNPKLDDAVNKAHALARYAERHGDCFGRIELIAVDDKGQLKRLDVNKEEFREKVNKVRDTAHLKALFED